MISPQNMQPNVIEYIDGTLQEWYNSVDSALRASEVRPGEYEYGVEVSYAGQCPVNNGGSTMVDLKSGNLRCVSIDNSYLEVKQTFTVDCSKAQVTRAGAGTVESPYTYTNRFTYPNGRVGRIYYFGYPTAFGIVDQYRVYSNGDLIQTVNTPHYEDLILNNVGVGDYAKNSSDVYATWEKVQRMDPNVPGVYVDLGEFFAAHMTVNITLVFRIPLNLFLVIKNLRWYPGFWGTTTFEIFPGHQNIVSCPVFPDGIGPRNNVTFNRLNGFSQINTENYDFVVDNAGSYSTVEAQTFTVTASKLEMCKIRLAQFVLKMDVYNALAAKYLQVPMLFPFQEVTAVHFSQSIGTGTSVDLTCSTTMYHCDAMFIVFRQTSLNRSCFINPELTGFQINIDGKLFPRDRYATVNDCKFTNMIFDALNINNSTLLSVPKDLAASLQPYYTVNGFNEGTAGGDASNVVKFYVSADRTKFMIGITFCNDEDFQAGLAPGGVSQIQLRVERASGAYDWTVPPIAIFLEDKVLKFYSMKPTGTPQISKTNATIEEIQLGAM